MRTRTGVVAVLLVFSGGCRCRQTSGYVAPPSGPAVAELLRTPWHALTLETVLQRFDVDKDGVVGPKDLAAVRACVSAKSAGATPACDVVPDGVLDEQDEYLLGMALGETTPRSVEQRKKLAQALRDNAAGVWGPPLGEGMYDWNRDGANDGKDTTALAGLVESDVTRFDLDGDGALTLRDVRALAVRQARKKYGDMVPAGLDVDGDGQSTSADVERLAELAQFVNLTSVGLLDVNQDGQLDLADFCLVSEAPDGANVLSAFLPAQQAQAAFAASPPRTALCRTDGRPLTRSMARLDTGFSLDFTTSNLFLTRVTDVPPGFTPPDPSKGVGRDLYVLGTMPSDRPLRALSLPWGGSSPNVSLRLGGPALPMNASLLTPTGISPLTTMADAPVVRVSMPPQLTGLEASSAAALAETLARVKQTYEGLIASCPCTLTQSQRDEAVRYLIRTSHCLSSTLSVTQAKLKEAELKLERLTRLYVSATNESAARQQLLADDIVAMELSKTLLLIAETGYDGLKEGPKGAFKSALSNLLGELANDYVLPQADNWATDTAVNLGSNVVTGIASNVVTELVGAAAGKEGLNFTKEFIKRMSTEFERQKFKGDQLEGALKTMVKMLPVYYLRYSQAVAEAAEARALKLAGEHQAALGQVATLRAAVAALTDALALFADLRTRLLAKLAADGCPMTISLADPCSFDLEAAIAAARRTLEVQDAEAARALDAAFANAGRDGMPSACTNGPERQALDSARAASVALAKELGSHARGGGTEEATAVLADRIDAASKNGQQARDDFSAVCQLPIDANITGDKLRRVLDAENQGQRALDDFAAAVRRALATYSTCLQMRGDTGGACAFQEVLAETNPFASAARCTNCLSSYVLNCCGDGRLQAGEQCDPGSTAFACQGGVTCTSGCRCMGSGVMLPPEVGALGTALGIPTMALETGWRPLSLTTTLHSSASVPAKPVANDHTTLTGYTAGRFTLDATTIASLRCGSGMAPFRSTLCPPGGMPLQPGPAYFFLTSLAAPLPETDPGSVYQYGFPLERDGLSANDYVPGSAFPNDFFGRTDFWLELNRTSAGAWSLKASAVMNNMGVATSTRAHGFLNGSAMGVVVNQSELSAMSPGFRFSAFCHRGDFGIPSPHLWSGSVYPPVAMPLLRVP